MCISVCNTSEFQQIHSHTQKPCFLLIERERKVCHLLSSQRERTFFLKALCFLRQAHERVGVILGYSLILEYGQASRCRSLDGVVMWGHAYNGIILALKKCEIQT